MKGIDSHGVEFTAEEKQAMARAAHEANRAFCLLQGDESQLPWEEAPEWQKGSCLIGVDGVIQGNNPKSSHASWLAVKTEEGWVYGEKKDVEAKTHPCMVPYEDLPPAQREKDSIFVGVVQQFMWAFARLRKAA